MLDFHEKRKLKRYLYSYYTAGFLALLSIPLGLSVYERFVVERAMAEKQAAAAEELQELQGRAAALESEVKRLQSARGVEEELRDRFEVSKEGEQVVIIIGDNERQHASQTAEQNNTDTSSSERRWWWR